MDIILIFHTKYPKNFTPRFAPRNFFSAPPITWNPGSAPGSTKPQWKGGICHVVKSDLIHHFFWNAYIKSPTPPFPETCRQPWHWTYMREYHKWALAHSSSGFVLVFVMYIYYNENNVINIDERNKFALKVNISSFQPKDLRDWLNTLFTCLLFNQNKCHVFRFTLNKVHQQCSDTLPFSSIRFMDKVFSCPTTKLHNSP